VDSFDGYVTSEIPVYWNNNTSAIITTPARTGVGALRPFAGGIGRSIGALLGHAIVGAAWTANEPGGPIFAFSQSGIPPSQIGGTDFQCQLIGNADGTVSIQQRSQGPILATSNPSGPVLQINVYSYIEWYASFTPGGGLNQVYINGQLVLSAFINTQGLPLPGADYVFLLGEGGGAVSLFDDFYLVNPDDGDGLTTFAGDSSVVCSVPVANGDVNNWTPVPPTNQNWQNVFEIPSTNGTLYNHSNGVNTADDYTVSPLLAITDKILAVQLMLMTFAEEPGDITNPFLSIQGTLYNDNANLFEPSTGQYTPTFAILERNPVSPGGLSPWTGPVFNATYWGIGHIDHPVKFSVHLYAVHNTNRGIVAGALIP